ncbi:MAG: PD-(D/E)XK nuclease family protein [Bryobacteraceae bacterium]
MQHGLRRACARRTDLGPRLIELERRRLKELLAAWLEHEKSSEPFLVVAREQERDIELGGVRTTVKVDRVDRLPDGREVILDYKTGECSVKSWHGDRPEDPQLPLYAVTHASPLAAVLYARIKAGETRPIGLHADRPLIRGAGLLSRETLDQWRDALQRLAQAFRGGYAAVHPKRPGQTCRTCRFEPLCRVYEAEFEPESGDEEP